MQQTPALGLPKYIQCFTLFVHKHGNQALGILLQEHGGKQRLIAYCSLQLDPVVRAYPNYLKAVDAAAELVEASAELVIRV